MLQCICYSFQAPPYEIDTLYDMERVYENIRTLRVLKGFSQEYLAQELDIHQSYYSRLERGVRDIPLSLLLKISELYSVPLDNLLNDDLSNMAKIMSEKIK